MSRTGDKRLNILIIGGGGREHAIAWKLAQSPKAGKLYIAPGNAGTAQLGTNIPLDPSDTASLLRAAREHKVGLTVVGPEIPLAAGVVDRFQAAGMPIFGPTRDAARLESSKAFARGLMQNYDIPGARYADFTSYTAARDYVSHQQPPIVVKADGLAAGKGVVVASTVGEALVALSDFMEKKNLGAAGSRVLIEECLVGREMSTFAFTDGNTVVPMVAACDYKRVFDGDKGPNTGGMGSYSPPPFLDAALMNTVREKVLEAVVRAMREEGVPYKGVIYGGLMITPEGPKVLEFNARFGDPETQVVLPRLKTDLLDIMLAVVNGSLDSVKVEWSEDACVGVVMASGGYPGSYRTGFPVSGLDKLDKDVMVFHAGTKLGTEPGQVLTSGGRVLTVVATGKDLAAAREKVYSNVSRVHFEGRYYRRDIALVR